LSNIEPVPDLLQRRNLAEQLYEILEKRIINCEILPGTKLSEEAIADTYRVSRSPAREALAELERIGLAVRTGARERMVSTPTEELVNDTFEIWWLLDACRTYLSSLNASEADHRRLLDLLEEIDRPETHDDNEKRVRLSKEFHALLTCRCANRQLDRIQEDYGKYVNWLKTLYFEALEKSETARLEHREIVDCYIKRDLVGLIGIARVHILRQRDLILSRLSGESGSV